MRTGSVNNELILSENLNYNGTQVAWTIIVLFLELNSCGHHKVSFYNESLYSSSSMILE